MTTPDPVIILKREPGPVAGMSLVTIDAPGFTQAAFVVDDRLKDTQEEQVILRRMMQTRAESLEAAKEGQV